MRLKVIRFRQRVAQSMARLVNLYVSEWPYLRLYLLRLAFRVACWIRLGVIAFMWISFEGYLRTWKFLQVFWEDLTGMRSTKAHRAIFCLSVSILVGHLVMLTLTPFRVSPWSLIFWTAHGMVVHTYWARGLRWCCDQMGMRRSGHYSAEEAFDGLDLGN